jgi:hypothetical protein
MVSFCQLWEQLDKDAEASPLMDSGLETKAVQAIRVGENLRGEDEPSFWEDFLQLCSNADGLAELLGVRREQVTSWPKKIRDAQNDLDRHNKQPDGENDQEQELLPTGETGAVTTANMGPFGKKGR